MKKTLMLAGFAILLAACNNHSDKADKTSDSADHAGYTNNDNNPDTNTMRATMDEMMRTMHTIKPTGNIDIDFAAMMVEHHKGAVDMSKLELAKGNDTALQAFARQVINDQDKEINFMKDFIVNASKTASPGSAAFQRALEQSMMVMMNDTTKPYNNTDRDFAAGMIPHHQSAVDMANVYLDYGKNRELLTLCRNIIQSQSKEIAWLKDWLKRTKA